MPIFFTETEKVSAFQMKDFVEMLSGFLLSTFRIFIVARRNSYTAGTLNEARSTNFDLLLTNVFDLKRDISEYVFQNESFLQKAIAEAIAETIAEANEKMQEEIQIMVAEQNRMLAEEAKTLRQLKRKISELEFTSKFSIIVAIVSCLIIITLLTLLCLK